MKINCSYYFISLSFILKIARHNSFYTPGGAAVDDPACDLVIVWTYLSGKSREIFIDEMDMDPDTWLRVRAWALWKATFELCQIANKNSPEAGLQKRIINEVING